MKGVLVEGAEITVPRNQAWSMASLRVVGQLGHAVFVVLFY